MCIRDSLNLLQLVDLGYGLCTFIEAEPAWRAGQAERNYARRGSLRVATKYPVSYTHLDVYKRQLAAWSSARVQKQG